MTESFSYHIVGTYDRSNTTGWVRLVWTQEGEIENIVRESPEWVAYVERTTAREAGYTNFIIVNWRRYA